jgi:mono/diheme cytochrome c family protein
VKNPIPDNPESRKRGQKIYEDKCTSCHGSRGHGKTEMGKSLNPPAPDFTDRHMMKEMTDGEIFWKITTGKGPMPSYKKELSEKERWDLVNYIKSFTKPK